MVKAWQALGGGELDGTSLTRFVYIDEAGISNAAQEPFLVVAGVIVHADRQLQELERRLTHLADRYIPSEKREDFVFHAAELFNGGGKVFDRNDTMWPLEKRLEIATQLANIPKKMKLPIAFGIVQRELWPLTFDGSGLSKKERIIGQHVTAYMQCVMEVERWMRTNASDEVTLMIAEDNSQARASIKQMQNAHRKPDAGKNLPPAGRKYFPFKKIRTSPLFEEKRDSPALQIADFCAYVMKKRAMNDQRYSKVFSLLHPMFVAHDHYDN